MFALGVRQAQNGLIASVKSSINCAAFCGFAWPANSVFQPLRHSSRILVMNSATSAQKNPKEPCRLLNSSFFMYLVFRRLMAFRSCSMLCLIRTVLVRMRCGIERERQALPLGKSVKSFRVEWCGQRAGNGFIVSEHCHGRRENPQGLGFTYFLRGSYSLVSVEAFSARSRSFLGGFVRLLSGKRIWRGRAQRAPPFRLTCNTDI